MRIDICVFMRDVVPLYGMAQMRETRVFVKITQGWQILFKKVF